MHRDTSSPSWYVAETIVRGEDQAQRNLERQGFASFCPRFRKVRRHARRVDYAMAPVFPGYLFVQFDRQRDAWRSINGTRGVRRLVGSSGSRPQAMPGPAMAALFDRCDGDRIAGLFSDVQQGQSVRLIAGPFANRLAEVERLDDRGRVHVLLELLGGNVSVHVELCAVGPA